MSLLSTKEVLEKEVIKFTERVEFLGKYIYQLEIDGSLDSLDKAYKLQAEKERKEYLIEQRKTQLKQIEDQDELKKKAIEELPNLIADCEDVLVSMQEDIETLKKSKPLKKEDKVLKQEEIVKIVNLKSQVEILLSGIKERHNDKNLDSVLNDFRQLHNIKKIKG